MREGFKASFNRLRVLWYDRHGKDDTIRQRVAATLASGCSVLVFAEGTTQRSGGQSVHCSISYKNLMLTQWISCVTASSSSCFPHSSFSGSF
jgi:hypothetical protein